MRAKPFQAFRSHSAAARYLGRDRRTVRRYEGELYEIDGTLPSPYARPRPCRVCGTLHLASENRAGYCPACSRAGEGRRSQARQLSLRHRGRGNPNWAHGRGRTRFRQERAGRRWRWAVLARDRACRCCGATETLHAHHVLPAALFPGHRLDVENGVTLCGFHHTELHRQWLDVRLLPTLWPSTPDALPWHEALCRRPEFRALRRLPVKPYRRRELSRVVPKNYRTLLRRLHPGLARRVEGRPASG